MKYNLVIGIDPDCEKSGVVGIKTHTKEIKASNQTFSELISGLQLISNPPFNEKIIVIVEAGYLNKSHWHLTKYDSKQTAAAKGNAVGRNHETARKIVEMCKHYGINVIEQKPLKKCWQGPDGKITHDEIKQFIPGFPSRSNQEVRDAALIAWNYAGFPIIVKPIKTQRNAVCIKR